MKYMGGLTDLPPATAGSQMRFSDVKVRLSLLAKVEWVEDLVIRVKLDWGLPFLLVVVDE